MSLNIEKLNFERCEDEPIHIPESIQSYGYLFALDADSGNITIVSENVCDLLVEQTGIIGHSFFSLMNDDEEALEFFLKTYRRAKERSTRLPARLTFKKQVLRQDAEASYFAVVYDSGGMLIVELEPAAKFREIYTAEHYIKIYAMSIAPKFNTLESLDVMAQEIVDTIRYITNMERVLLYRFNDDDSGKVIAEARVDDIESYLDTYYPASDIPPQARELYKKNWVRLTPNVDLQASRLIPEIKDSGRPPLDLTHSLLRTLSPIHQQYIRNQGLQASFSMSLVTHDRLWGLISCHSRKATYISQDVRLQCENLSQLFSWHLYAKEEQLAFRQKERTDQSIQRMLDRVSPTFPIVEVFAAHQDEVLKLMDADGFIFYSDQESIAIGTTPDLPVILEIYAKADSRQGRPFITSQITRYLEDHEALHGILGVMLIPLVERKNYFTAWFRKEQRYIQKWAGLPQEKSINASKRERLTPRTSFQVHIKEINGASKEFDQNDVDMAGRFNRMFLAHALEVQEKMRKNMSDLERQDRHKNEFLATLAHELRNPLAPISAGVSLLEHSESEEIRHKVTATIKRQVSYMTKLIDDLMDVSRITRGKVKLEQRILSIQEVIRNSIEMVDSLIKAKQHHLSVNMPDAPLLLRGDNARLSQIFSNVLNNAIKYTEAGGRISLNVTATQEQIIAVIQDNGLGIPKDKLQDIFLMFTQVEAHSTHTKGGLGIGLTLVDKLIRLHEGKITARSAGLNCGSEFEIVLPRVKGEADGGSDSAELQGKSSGGLRVMLVDDNPDVTGMLELLLQYSGYETRTAGNGREAIEMFPGFRPHVALLDIGMPDMDGYELCLRLRALPEARDTAFFSQSGWGNKEYRDRALAVGFVEHFVKPLDIKVLEYAFRTYGKSRESGNF